MTWKEQAPLLYVVISVLAALSFAVAFIVAIRRQPHRFKRIRRFFCCLKEPLHSYTSVEESDPFVIDDDDVDEEIEIPIRDKSDSIDSTEHMEAGTV